MKFLIIQKIKQEVHRKMGKTATAAVQVLRETRKRARAGSHVSSGWATGQHARSKRQLRRTAFKDYRARPHVFPPATRNLSADDPGNT
jgi:hypothetical protein